ncbi:unnamed protein product [Staurois parvus]|uniref:Uncharacterized protein n=1 Tax=Staurois parvus TaxID=386267 RepID=A0ABN9FCK5_9NEOB|nr:unnamed protein product [Staurois parvus]
MYVRTYIHTCTCTHMYMHADTCTHTHTHTHPPIKSCSTSLFTHRVGYCSLGGGREHSTLLALLSLRSAIEQSGSQCQ